MYALVTRAKFVDAISQEIGLRPPRFIPELGQSADLGDAFVLDLRRLLIKPISQWNLSVFAALQKNLGLSHFSLMFSFLITAFNWPVSRRYQLLIA